MKPFNHIRTEINFGKLNQKLTPNFVKNYIGVMNYPECFIRYGSKVGRGVIGLKSKIYLIVGNNVQSNVTVSIESLTTLIPSILHHIRS